MGSDLGNRVTRLRNREGIDSQSYAYLSAAVSSAFQLINRDGANHNQADHDLLHKVMHQTW
jgi:hypothetical protein